MHTEIDVRGLSCPLPVMHTKRAVVEGADALRVHVDSGTAKQNVVNLLNDAGFAVEVAQSADKWTITATRT
jgi:tRNA 2-thiouridine synthesizing protein A